MFSLPRTSATRGVKKPHKSVSWPHAPQLESFWADVPSRHTLASLVAAARAERNSGARGRHTLYSDLGSVGGFDVRRVSSQHSDRKASSSSLRGARDISACPRSVLCVLVQCKREDRRLLPNQHPASVHRLCLPCGSVEALMIKC